MRAARQSQKGAAKLLPRGLLCCQACRARTGARWRAAVKYCPGATLIRYAQRPQHSLVTPTYSPGHPCCPQAHSAHLSCRTPTTAAAGPTTLGRGEPRSPRALNPRPCPAGHQQPLLGPKTRGNHPTAAERLSNQHLAQKKENQVCHSSLPPHPEGDEPSQRVQQADPGFSNPPGFDHTQ